MIGLNIPMPVSCLQCPCSAPNVKVWNGVYETICWGCAQLAISIKSAQIGTRPADCPLIDLSRLEDDGK